MVTANNLCHGEWRKETKMRKDDLAILNLLGEQNVDKLRTDLMEIIKDQLIEDLEECSEYIIVPDDYQEFMQGVIKECKDEIKEFIKPKLLAKALKDLDSLVQ